MLVEVFGSTARSTMPPQSSDIGTICNEIVAGDRWYVVQTQPRAESKPIARLRAARLPQDCTPCPQGKVRSCSLFPNYLFLHLDMSCDMWRAVNGTRGDVRLISQGERPQPLPCEVVEDLLAKTNASGVLDWTLTFKIGQAVRMLTGHVASLIGKLKHIDGAGRVRVLLDLLGRSISVAPCGARVL